MFRYLSSVEILNFGTNSWKTGGSLNRAHFYPAVHIYRNNLIVFGGAADIIRVPNAARSIKVWNGTKWNDDGFLERDFVDGVSVQVICPV